MEEHIEKAKGNNTIDDITWFDIIKGSLAIIIVYIILYKLYTSMLLLE